MFCYLWFHFRNALIVKEHGTIPYPEGTACAEVLLAGEEGGASAKSVFAGMGFAALFKFVLMELRLFLVLLQHLLSHLRQNFQQKYIRHYLV